METIILISALVYVLSVYISRKIILNDYKKGLVKKKGSHVFFCIIPIANTAFILLNFILFFILNKFSDWFFGIKKD